jgi:DNA-binding CsgD family transcriptional regulator
MTAINLRTNRTHLTGREIEVLKLLARGDNYKRIGAQLGLTHSTVRTHISNAIAVLGASDGTSAVLHWLRSPTRVASAAENLHDKHPQLSPDGWLTVVGHVLDELFGMDEREQAAP